jgi:hypothetical protein
MSDNEVRDYAPAVVRLLQGPVYEEDGPVWKLLLTHAAAVQRHFAQIAVELVVDESEGYAYLTQPEAEGETGPARLVRRSPLSFEVSLLLVILREELDHFDSSNADARRLHLSAHQIRDDIALYFKEKTDQTRLARELDRYIRQVVDLGFLREVRPDGSASATEVVYEVRRIIKAKVNNDFLERFKTAMENEPA